MPKMSTEQVKAELTRLQIAFDDGAGYSDLLALLQSSPEYKAEVDDFKEQEGSITHVNVPCGHTTINEHEKRITEIEKKLGLIK